MMHIKEILFISVLCGCCGLSNAIIEDDLLSFSKCHILNRNILRSFYKDSTLFVWVSDTLYSFPRSQECSGIRVELVNHTHICQGIKGELLCYVVALDDSFENNFLVLDFPVKKERIFRLKNSDGKEKKLKGDFLWGIRRMLAFMRENTVVLIHRDENRKYELITYKINQSSVREVFREKYPYPIQEDSWGMPKDYVFPCDGKMCIYNDKTKQFYRYTNKFLAK